MQGRLRSPVQTWTTSVSMQQQQREQEQQAEAIRLVTRLCASSLRAGPRAASHSFAVQELRAWRHRSAGRLDTLAASIQEAGEGTRQGSAAVQQELTALAQAHKEETGRLAAAWQHLQSKLPVS